MAGEISLRVNFSVDKNESELTRVHNLTLDLLGNEYEQKVISIGTTQEAVNLDSAGDIGLVMVKNLDGTNFITMGTTTGQLGVVVYPGEVALFRSETGALFMKADTADCLAEVILLAP